MSLLDLFRRKKKVSSSEEKLNHMWDLWTKNKIPSPYKEIMEYESEVNNGGHDQYFFNVSNCGDLTAAATALLSVLPKPMRVNFSKAYDAYLKSDEIDEDCDDDSLDEILEECDSFFYENEKLIIDILQAYSETI